MSQLKKAYLIGYNTSLCVGWAVVLARVVQFLINKPANADYAGVYPLIKTVLLYSQTAALMEILHALVDLVRSPVATTFLQVMSRIIVLYGALEIGSVDVHRSWFLPQMLIAWSITEVIRYAFYTLSQVLDKQSMPAALTWLRYSTFTVLSPLGLTGEIMCLYNALPYIKAREVYTLRMPNSINFAFDFYNAVWFGLLCVYPFGSYVMYTYMLGQRKKVLAGAAKPAAKKTE